MFDADFVEHIDFTKPWKVAEALLPYQNELMVITARGEGGASRLREVIPHVPYLRTPTPDSLKWATDKYEMRKRLRLFDPKNTPRFTKVKDNTKQERKRIIQKVRFPMVVKPASLQGSMLVHICYHEEELEKALGNIFRKLKNQYEKHIRLQLPTVIAEEFMEGDMYSIDTYVDSRGVAYHCPMVRVKTGRDIGHDDFYNYTQTTPVALKRTTIDKAQHLTETAIHALGLRSVTTHIELMKVEDDWKVIEVGPRIGGFRPLLHELSCDINHSLNDILVRLPKKPVIPKKCKGYATALKWYARKEGVIKEMKGIKKIESVDSFHSINVAKKIGDRAHFSKNGGKAIFVVFLFNKERSKLLADIRRIEKLVKIKVG
jgi:biotin carboxylase